MLLRGRLRRKAQSSIEFVMLISFTLLVASVLFYVMQNNLMEAEKDRNEARVGQLMNIINNEIALAQVAVPDYSRTFYLPNELYGFEYEIEARNHVSGSGTDVVIRYKGQEYIFLLTTRIENPNLLKRGENMITRTSTGTFTTVSLQSS